MSISVFDEGTPSAGALAAVGGVLLKAMTRIEKEDAESAKKTAPAAEGEGRAA